MTSDSHQTPLLPSLTALLGTPVRTPENPGRTPETPGNHRSLGGVTGVPGFRGSPPPIGGGETPKENPERTPVTHDLADNTEEPRNMGEEGGWRRSASGQFNPNKSKRKSRLHFTDLCLKTINVELKKMSDLFGKSVKAKIYDVPRQRPEPSGFGELRLEAIKLEASLGEADDELFKLQYSYDFFESEFNTAHGVLVAAWANNDHSLEAQARRKPLYDARMAAGVAWNPTKRAYHDLKSWRRTIVKSLKAINEELD